MPKYRVRSDDPQTNGMMDYMFETANEAAARAQAMIANRFNPVVIRRENGEIISLAKLQHEAEAEAETERNSNRLIQQTSSSG